MLLNIPDSVIENQIIPQFVQIAVTEFEKRMRLVTKTIELPPFSNKETVKEVLGIGDAKLNSWIDQGLKIQVWSKQDIRIRREALQQLIHEKKGQLSERQHEKARQDLEQYQEIQYQNRLNRQMNI